MRILIFLILLSNTLFAQKRDSVFVKTSIYDVIYSERLEQPIWIKYTVKCPDGSYPRKGMDFYVNDSIHTSDDLDYEKNIYDKGHMAPAADFNCDRKTLFTTFSYLNCALQNESLNRGTWKKLELHERELAKTGNKVDVEIICIFSDSSTKLSSGATIPDGFYKIIRYSGNNIRYYFPNKAPVHSDYNKYLIK